MHRCWPQPQNCLGTDTRHFGFHEAHSRTCIHPCHSRIRLHTPTANIEARQDFETLLQQGRPRYVLLPEPILLRNPGCTLDVSLFQDTTPWQGD